MAKILAFLGLTPGSAAALTAKEIIKDIPEHIVKISPSNILRTEPASKTAAWGRSRAYARVAKLVISGLLLGVR